MLHAPPVSISPSMRVSWMPTSAMYCAWSHPINPLALRRCFAHAGAERSLSLKLSSSLVAGYTSTAT